MGHQTLAPLDLIFSDVWGPSPMLSSNGFRYFVNLWMPYKVYLVLSDGC
jgi:hypothetical protein